MYQRIMVPLDGSELAECVLSHAEAIAKGCNDEIILVRVVEPLHLFRGEEYSLSPEERKQLEEESMQVARDYLHRIMDKLEDKGLMVKYEVLYGKVADKLIDYANNNQIGLIIIATHGRSGISRWVWGSVADRILRAACLPVMIVRVPGCEHVYKGSAQTALAKA